jgi:hypothetical protein
MNLDKMHEAAQIAFGLHLQFTDQAFRTHDEAAGFFGLKHIGSNWSLIDRVTAQTILCRLLREDMAFSSPRIPEPAAQAEAHGFLSEFTSDARFYTNGNWEDGWTNSRFGGASLGPDWHPATEATFDGGVLALDTESSGVLWLEDED